MKGFLLLVVAVGMLSAPSAIGSGLDTNGVFESYPYDPATAQDNVLFSSKKKCVVDDFTGDCTITSYTCWGVSGKVAPPTALRIFVVEDKDGAPFGDPISSKEYPCKTTYSEYMWADIYKIWCAVVDLSEAPIAVDGTIWIGSSLKGSTNWLVLTGTTLTGNMANVGEKPDWAWKTIEELDKYVAADLFKIIEGDGVSLEATTWAGIKSQF